MKTSVAKVVLCLAVCATAAKAHEYPLQFSANSGARGLVVAGYSYNGNTIVGNCSYYTVQSGSGRGGGYHSTTTYYNQTCVWDFFGNLLSITPGAAAIPTPLYINGSQKVYATNGAGDFTGVDSSLPTGGFVNTPGSHYTWQTSSAYAVIPQALYTFTVTLKSDGDLPLEISNVEATALLGKVTVNRGTCIGQIAVGMTCSATITYDPSKLRSATGLAYETLDISVISDAGQAADFVQSYTVVLKQKSDDN